MSTSGHDCNATKLRFEMMIFTTMYCNSFMVIGQKYSLFLSSISHYNNNDFHLLSLNFQGVIDNAVHCTQTPRPLRKNARKRLAHTYPKASVVAVSLKCVNFLHWTISTITISASSAGSTPHVCTFINRHVYKTTPKCNIF